jgi:hypothetical protein
MFGYNPTVQDRSGEITAAGQLQGAQGLAGGITAAASGISGALDKISGLKMQAAQTDSTAALAHRMGIIDADAFNTIRATPWAEKINLGPSLIQLVGQKTMADRYAMMAGLSQQKLDQQGASSSTKTTPVDLY